MTIKRMRFLQELLALMGLGGRLHLDWISSAEAQKFIRVVTDFTEKIRALGPNPLAGKIVGKLELTSMEMTSKPGERHAMAGQ